MDFDPVTLARIQFAFTVSFHIIFPSFTIGLSAFIAVLELLWLKTGREVFHRLARYWTKIFAVSFAMGVVSGIVLSYQFGTNWSRFAEVAGSVIAPLIGFEVLTAFFLEATFLGIMLFGWNRVPAWLHVLATCVVAFGTFMSAFWILSANSWMQTPAGFEMRDGVAYPLDWLEIIFNPSFLHRLPHMLLAAYLTTSLVVLAVGARYLLAGRFQEEAKVMVVMAIGMLAIVAPIQAYVGDAHGLNTAKYQPAKIAAIEAHWDGSKPAPLVLFAWPDAKAEKNLYEISIPGGASLMITHSLTGLFPGLKDFPPQDRPPVIGPFFGFRAMVGVGVVMILFGWVGAFLLWRRKVFETRWYLWPASLAWPLGFIAILSGWIVTEQGRQPWVIQGILRTADAVSPVIGWSVAVTLVLFIIVYSIVFATGLYFMNRLIVKGPGGTLIEPPRKERPTRPLAAAHGEGQITPGE
ncbi:cytochrome ubiquinol oxidase subunit I [Xanthobacter tagetidis]|uniref:Cytochrome ubiquinol oxidase subunit I n=1 Tax=Xanthobacter tagetidis TaxID=60216 RepID=A0A3L7A624_9HYPH|nr:cytochrome ubiquinol oxidase subunit I [Xanthobacter tagetidis]MBB6307245.1 cytochrome d ubiquinol oxidase subunit I [Xanthobacter tagetidis]RLP75793.1 cytochrome ubiquinol oxidase subunit I [Xanthobacter tagetidis]